MAHARPVVVILALAAFVSLGLPDGLLGVAWPSIRRSFAVPLSHLGALLLAIMLGYLASSFSSGAVVTRLGVGRLLAGSNLMVALSFAGYALAPGWPVMLAWGLVAGLGAGAVDAGINVHASAHFSPRLVSWLHASWGAGAALGPLIMTAVLWAGLVWRWGYVLVAIALAALSLCFLRTAPLWGAAPAEEAASRPRAPAASLRHTLGQPTVWIQVAVFFLYAGLEAGAGQWAFTLLTEARQVAPPVAGAWVAGYWASLTLGRFACGAVAHRVTTESMLRVCLSGALLGAALIWGGGRSSSTLAGLVLLGFALAPVFPLLISATPGRLGGAHAVHAIGFQVAAACLGGAVLPGVAGLLARAHGLEAIAAFLVAAAVVLLFLHEVLLARLGQAGGV